MRPFKSLIKIQVFSLAFLLTSEVLGQSQCERSPELHSQSISGSLSREDFETYLELPFQVVEGTKKINVHFSYDNSERTTVDLGLADVNGFRGWSGGNKSYFTVAENFATPSYNAGPIDPGTWRVVLGVPNIREKQQAQYQVDITLECNLTPDEVPLSIDRGQAWYVGDLHVHTGHSDGSCDSKLNESVPCPVHLSLEAAVTEGLDFLSITEHNAVSQSASSIELQAYYDSVLMVPGREVTTFYGHGNVFGSTEFIDFRLQAGTSKNADFLHDQVEELGALLSINHPGSPSGEDCMGCGWVLENTDYSKVTAMEIVNVGYVDLPRGKAHINFWEQKLNEGYKITGIGGSDNHRASRPISHPSAIGNPRTWIFADQLSVSSLLDGIRGGKVYVDASAGKITLKAFTLNEAEMGGEVLIGDEGAEVFVSWESDEALIPVFIHQGAEIHIENQSGRDAVFQGELAKENLTLPGWIRINLLDEKGRIRLLSNPIYLERN